MIEDVVKLIFQSVYGATHFAKNPSKERIFQGLVQECQDIEHIYDQHIVKLANGYIRVPIQLVSEKHYNDFSEMFYQSMMIKGNLIKQQKRFNKALNQLIQHIKKQKLKPFDQKEIYWILNHVINGFPLLSHSKQYKTAYHPHYRVISKRFFKNFVFNND